MSMQSHGTPGISWFEIMRSSVEDNIPDVSQFQHRSNVRMISYLIKDSRNYLANMNYELSKCMDDVNVAAYKEMIRVIRFVLDARDTCLKLKPNLDDEKEDLVVYVVTVTELELSRIASV
jgi:hypothetical protein